ncbi:MAG: group III truncated hemoglobin [Mucilaginibacter sp.]
MNDIEDIGSIRLLVDKFYASVRQDVLIGPIFNKAIGDNWAPHLEKMYAFWNAVLFAEPGFTGNPFAKHAPLPIDAEHFSRWLTLFRQTLDECFEGPVATEAKNRAELMAILFQNKLERMHNDPGKFIA